MVLEKALVPSEKTLKTNNPTKNNAKEIATMPYA
jgi:hypothetical protein